MRPVNPFGVYWPSAGRFEIAGVLLLLLAALGIYLVIRYFKLKEQRRINNNQMFLFQVKRKGLSNFQIKLLNNMASYLRLANPTTIVTSSRLFENSLEGFCQSLPFKSEERENLEAMCRDLALMYEKLYVTTTNRKGLAGMNELENGQILFFSTESGQVCLGKVTGRSEGSVTVSLFGGVAGLTFPEEGLPVTLYIMRVNDAEYSARTTIRKAENRDVEIALTEDFTMDREYRHPYVNVIIPVTLMRNRRNELEEEEELPGTIFRINEYECVVRMSHTLSFERTYGLLFEIMEYKFNVNTSIISSRTVDSEKVYYFTMKFENMSEAGRGILKRFISDHM